MSKLKSYTKGKFDTDNILKSIAKIIYWIIITISILSLFGCKSFYLRKAIEKNPLIFTDSVRVVHYEKKDSIFIVEEKDTIFLNNENKVFTRIYRHYDTLRVEQEIKSDTVFMNKVELKNESRKILGVDENEFFLGVALTFIMFLSGAVMMFFLLKQ